MSYLVENIISKSLLILLSLLFRVSSGGGKMADTRVKRVRLFVCCLPSFLVPTSHLRVFLCCCATFVTITSERVVYVCVFV